MRWCVWLCFVSGCSRFATDRGNTVVYASGADLQSINPLLTTHPLARQVQRYVLLTTLVQYDSSLNLAPYLARRWQWSNDSTQLVMQLSTALRWHDGQPTTARDAAWTLDAARDVATGYPRMQDLADITAVDAIDDSTLQIGFSTPQHDIPDVLTDLAILPAHLFHDIPHAQLRSAPWNLDPVGNGPFEFVSHQANRRWVFRARNDFPTELGGSPRISRLVIAVVDEPTTKLAALTSGELDFAGIQPAHAAFVRDNPRLAVIEYPLLMTYGLVFNVRRSPFDRLGARRSVAASLDRQAIVDGYLFGFGKPATDPLPQDSNASRRFSDTTLSLNFEMLTVGSGEAALEQLIQSQLSRHHIDASIRQLELTAFLDRVERSHEFDAAVMGIPGDIRGGQLHTMLAVAGLDPPTDRATQLRWFADSTPIAFLYHARGLQGMNRRMRGVSMDVRGELATLRRWWIAP